MPLGVIGLIECDTFCICVVVIDSRLVANWFSMLTGKYQAHNYNNLET